MKSRNLVIAIRTAVFFIAVVYLCTVVAKPGSESNEGNWWYGVLNWVTIGFDIDTCRSAKESATITAYVILAYSTVIAACFHIFCVRHPGMFRNLPSARQWFDSIYYLGFIGTLVSLTMTIGSIESPSICSPTTDTRIGREALDLIELQALFSGAAMAMTSTAFAVFCRTISMIWAQGRLSREEPSADVADVAASLEKVQDRATEMALALEDLNTRLINVEIDADTYQTAIQSAVQKSLEGGIGATRAVQSELSNSIGQLNRNLSDLAKQNGSLVEDVKLTSKAFSNTRQALDAMQRRLDRLAPSKLLSWFFREKG